MSNSSPPSYSIIAKLLHWVSAICIISLFALGWWMMDLDYDDDWYTLGPYYHISVGIVFSILILIRIVWRLITPPPAALPSLPHWEYLLAHITHYILYVLIVIVLLSGYLIEAANEHPIDVFNWFTLPAIETLFERQADNAGLIHQWGAYILIGLATIHIVAACKHHFIDKDSTLRRML